jgi:PAS domain S-box-containing protein
MITVEILDSKKLIEDACALLYDVYIGHMKWGFDPKSPSNLRVEVKEGRKFLLDDFFDKATWFGAFNDQGAIIGCIRVCGVDANNKFEIERYPSSQVVWDHLKQKKSCVELTKLAIRTDYVGKGVMKKLLLFVFQYCEKQHFSIFTCTHNGYLKYFYEQVEFPLIKEQAFKYEPQDSMPVNFYFANYKNDEVNTMVGNLKYFSRNTASKKYNLFELLHIVAPVLPVPVYWHDTAGVLLGINEQCLKAIGTSREIVGKSPYDFYPKKVADHILEHNKKVMQTEQILSQEEKIEDITTKQVKYFAAVKAPLYDDGGKVIGIVGTSIDITAQKEAEQLKHENRRLEMHNQLNKIVIEKEVAEKEKLKLENELHKSENERQKGEIRAQETFKKCLDEIQHVIQNYKISILHEKLGVNPKPAEVIGDITLSKREREILYYLSLNKSPKDIATILSVLDKKAILPTTVQSVIDKQLYQKLDVFNIGQLIEKANMLKLIPFAEM